MVFVKAVFFAHRHYLRSKYRMFNLTTLILFIKAFINHYNEEEGKFFFCIFTAA